VELIATWDEKPAYRRLALSPLNRLVRNTMLLISFVFLLIQIILSGFALQLSAFMIAALVAGLVAASGRRWSPLPAALVSLFLLYFLSREIRFDLTHPIENKPLFYASAILTSSFLVAIVTGIGATIQNYRRPLEERREPRWTAHALVGLATLCLGAIIVTAMVRQQVDLTAGISPAAMNELPRVTASLVRFTQKEIHVKVGQMVTLRLDNHDLGIHSFDVDEFNVHAPMPAGQSGIAIFKPTKLGNYTFYCSIPGHRDLMNGTLVVEP